MWLDSHLHSLDTQFSSLNIQLSSLEIHFSSLDIHLTLLYTQVSLLDIQFQSLDIQFSALDIQFCSPEIYVSSLDIHFTPLNAQLLFLRSCDKHWRRNFIRFIKQTKKSSLLQMTKYPNALLVFSNRLRHFVSGKLYSEQYWTIIDYWRSSTTRAGSEKVAIYEYIAELQSTNTTFLISCSNFPLWSGR